MANIDLVYHFPSGDSTPSQQTMSSNDVQRSPQSCLRRRLHRMALKRLQSLRRNAEFRRKMLNLIAHWSRKILVAVSFNQREEQVVSLSSRVLNRQARNGKSDSSVTCHFTDLELLTSFPQRMLILWTKGETTLIALFSMCYVPLRERSPLRQ